MASDRSLFSASPSSRAPHESPCLATAGSGCSCTTQRLLPIRSARPRERFSDLLTMIDGKSMATLSYERCLPFDLRAPFWRSSPLCWWSWNHVLFKVRPNWCQMVVMDVPPASPLSQLQPTFRAEYGGLLRCRRCSRCLPASGQAGHRLGGCQVAWGARELVADDPPKR